MKNSTFLFSVCLLPLAIIASGCARQSTASAQLVASEVDSARPVDLAPDELSECCKDPIEKTIASSLLQPLTAIPDAEGYRRSAWLEPAARNNGKVLDLNATDQDGRKLAMSALHGRPLALSFLYTRCTNPNKCPLIATRIASLARLLESEGLDTRVHLVIVTYDPAFDTPERLKEYGLSHGIRFTPNVLMLRPDDREKDRFLDQLQVAVNYNAEGVNLHGIQLFLFDDRGRFVRRYQTVIWDNNEVVADLKRLASECKPGTHQE